MAEGTLVDSPEGFLSAVEEAKAGLSRNARKFGLKSDGRMEFWYRGVPRRDFKLIPSLLRFPNGLKSERDLYESYVEHRAPNRKDWDALFEIQHYFIPTRLLDWTSSPGVALHFALSSDQEQDKPTIWVLHPGLLNKRALSEGTWQSVAGKGALSREALDSMKLSYRGDYLGRSKRFPDGPIAITPEAAIPRLRAQRGRFTVHGKDLRDLEQQFPEALARVVIDNRASGRLAAWAAMTGVDVFSIFPDDVGLAHFLRQQYNLNLVLSTQSLSAHLRRTWTSDAARLRQSGRHGPGLPLKAGLASGKVANAGIENCAVFNDYVRREMPETNALAEWLVDDTAGGVRIVAGAAGSGKTNYLVNLLLARRIHEKRPVIWFPLFRFAPDLGLRESIKRHLLTTLEQTGFDLSIAVSQLLRNRETVLVLDGLDELSRTKGREAALALAQELTQGLVKDRSDMPRVLLTCRDEILENLNRGGELAKRLDHPDIRPFGPFVLLKPLPAKALTARGVARNASRRILQLLGEFPIFLRLPKIPAEATDSSHLFLSALSGASKEGRAKLEALGRVAREMLYGRQDFLRPEDLSDLNIPSNLFSDQDLQPLIEEAGKDVRFFHHTLREFVLGWNVRNCLTGENKDWNLLRETSDLDYEGTEIYRVVSELGGIPDWAAVRQRCQNQDESDLVRYNNFAWNCFEAAGMMGVKQPSQRVIVLDWIHEVLRGPMDGRDRRYRFKTKYNAARCLERLHVGSPRCHWKWVVDHYRGRRITDGDTRIYAMAVRGFQRKSLTVDTAPPLVFASGAETPNVDKQQSRFSDLLLERIEELAGYFELSDEARYCLVNMSHALVRWYQPGTKSRSRVLDLLANATHLDMAARQNLLIALFYWEQHDAGEVSRTEGRVGTNRYTSIKFIGNGVVATPSGQNAGATGSATRGAATRRMASRSRVTSVRRSGAEPVES